MDRNKEEFMNENIALFDMDNTLCAFSEAQTRIQVQKGSC